MHEVWKALMEITFITAVCGVILKLADKHSSSPKFTEKKIINRRAVVILIAICAFSGIFGYIDSMNCSPSTATDRAVLYVGAYVIGAALPQVIARLVLYRLGVQTLIQCIAGIVGGHSLGQLLVHALAK